MCLLCKLYGISLTVKNGFINSGFKYLKTFAISLPVTGLKENFSLIVVDFNFLILRWFLYLLIISVS